MKAIHADITTLSVDAIVNAANSSLLAIQSCADSPLDITFCCFSPADLDHYTQQLGA